MKAEGSASAAPFRCIMGAYDSKLTGPTRSAQFRSSNRWTDLDSHLPGVLAFSNSSSNRLDLFHAVERVPAETSQFRARPLCDLSFRSPGTHATGKSEQSY